eukprot:TRINITY_DN4155_c0_g1_i11.p2 TRINITY_DN4155_c0_g1~~TRINITY_DN4155_c0_g1_i11.p2  ORF type:complete len:117 (+),score=14.05 TRINITY_DN4155_c0_g1_i11:85-435(+)
MIIWQLGLTLLSFFTSPSRLVIPSTARPSTTSQLDYNPLLGGPGVREPPAPIARDSDYAARTSNSYLVVNVRPELHIALVVPDIKNLLNCSDDGKLDPTVKLLPAMGPNWGNLSNG